MGLLAGSLKWSLDSLYVESSTRVLKFRPWPDPGVWAGMSTTHCQTPIDAKIGLTDFDKERKRRKGYEARSIDCFFVRLPPHIREAVAMSAQLKTEVGASHWKTPAELVQMKRTEIVNWLEFPGGKSTVKLLGRVSTTALKVPHLRKLRSLLAQKDSMVHKRLRHLEQISPDALALLCSPDLLESVSANLLDQAGAMPTFGAFLTTRLELYFENSRRFHPNESPPKIESIEQLELLEVYQGLELEKEITRAIQAKLKFPKPPVPGNDNIIPLENATELVHESAAQGNCASTYFSRVREGRFYLYRMMLPERCTISLERTGHGWRLAEIKTAGNRHPQKEATMRVVKRWLQDAGRGSRPLIAELPGD